MKPEFVLDFSRGAHRALVALEALSLRPKVATFHLQRGFREPRGIYGVSTRRILDKVVSLSEKVESYLRLSTVVKDLHEFRGQRVALIDYIELALYSAAEHVDDLESIATGYFATIDQARRNNHFRAFQGSIRSYKRFVTVAANSIKHKQSRIRLYSCEYKHGLHAGCLHGFFVEGVNDGVVGPFGPLHKTQSIYSVTFLLWEIIWFVLSCSTALRDFLSGMTIHDQTKDVGDEPQLLNAVAAAARLPNYTFGEQHPFSKTTFRLVNCELNMDRFASGLYGSMTMGWGRDAIFSASADAVEYEGDGSTRSFAIVKPTKVVLQHWD